MATKRYSGLPTTKDTKTHITYQIIIKGETIYASSFKHETWKETIGYFTLRCRICFDDYTNSISKLANDN